MKHWFELKIDRVENLSIKNLSIENSSNKLKKKLNNKNTDWKSRKSVKINF